MSETVAVIGAGPSGLAAAIAARAAGVAVDVFERGPAVPVRLPETLYEPAQEELRRLGVALPPTLPSYVCFTSHDGSISMQVQIECKQFLPVIDRAALDGALRQAARLAGVQIRTGAAVLAIEPAATQGWLLRGPDGKRDSASVVIDATGKAALASSGPLAAFAEPVMLDARSSVFSHFERERPFDIDTTNLIAAPQGFFYGVPMTANRICLGWVSYAGQHCDEASYQQAIAACPAVSVLLDGATRVLPVIAAKNAETRISRPAVAGLFVTGDALGFRDPFFWDGIGHALASGTQAGAAAAAVALGQLTAEAAAAAYTAALPAIARRSAEAAEAALSGFAEALSPVMLLDPHMAPPLLAALLGLAGPVGERRLRGALRARRGRLARRAAA